MKQSIGLHVKPPAERCEDIKCAWHGQLAVRGRVLQGTVKSDRMRNTVVVEWPYAKYVPKYNRYERRKSRVTAHAPGCLRAKQGETVIIAECRPLAKTKKFVVVGKVEPEKRRKVKK